MRGGLGKSWYSANPNKIRNFLKPRNIFRDEKLEQSPGAP